MPLTSIWGVHKTHSRLTGMGTLQESCMRAAKRQDSRVDTVVQKSCCDNWDDTLNTDTNQLMEMLVDLDSTNNRGQVPVGQGEVQMPLQKGA